MANRKHFPKNFIAVLCSTFLILPLICHAAGAKSAAYAAHVEQWGMQEVSLRSSIAYNNPFSDVQLQAEFTSDGKSILVKGFYDGDQTWRVRFMPEALVRRRLRIMGPCAWPRHITSLMPTGSHIFFLEPLSTIG
jgi:hypothetical protein